ncbi:septation protein SepH [Buchananella felis]|uniref:septation protein SepH n=1 Tax=Buchananella felis TaxID=3231492 RepID=UPI003529ABD4
MIELELLGVDSTGDRLVLVNAEGERFTLEIDDSLRATVRRSRPALVPAQGTAMRPKEIQALLRAGATPAEVAEASGMAVEMVEKFAAPVRGEQAWAVERAQNCRVGHDADAPTLGDLVVDRLAARAVDPSSLQWDAIRRGNEPWEVFVTFVQAAEEREARWSVDLSTGSVRGLNDQARWLTETSTPGPLPAGLRAHAPQAHAPGGAGLAAPGGSSRAQGAAGSPEPGHATVSHLHSPAQGVSLELLDQLDQARGRRAGETTPPPPPPPPAEPLDAARVLSLPRRSEESALSTAPRLGADVPAGLPSYLTGGVSARTDKTEAHAPQPGVQAEAAAGGEAERDERGKGRGGRGHKRGQVSAEPTLFEEGASAGGAQGDEPGGADAAAVSVPAPEEAEKPKRGARRSIPTWDEIVFGSRR